MNTRPAHALLLLAAMLPGEIITHAQTGTNAVPTLTTPSFFTSAQNYLTQFNPAYTWTNLTLEASLGYKQVTGVGAASVADFQTDLGRWNLGGAFQFSGVGSPINSAQAQSGYALIRHLDTKVDLDLRAGYDWTTHAAALEPALFLAKKITPNTFLKTGISLPVALHGPFNRNPSFYLETGFTY